ncbi:Astrotactin-2, partial [Crenichthys baileyi]
MSGTGEEISQVHWKQQWLENGTLYFHVSMTEPELMAQTTQPTAREPAHALHEHMHLLHISVMIPPGANPNTNEALKELQDTISLLQTKHPEAYVVAGDFNH